MLDATDLLRAISTDVDAVAQYLRTIDNEELDQLLDQFATDESQRKSHSTKTIPVVDEWLLLVHQLLRCDKTRQRTAMRIIQLLWRGNASELESMQWLTEISLGYVTALDSDRQYNSHVSENNVIDGIEHSTISTTLVSELRVMLQVVFDFTHDVLPQPRARKVLPQLLALVPLLLGILVDTMRRLKKDFEQSDDTMKDVVREHVSVLLELPWNANTVPFLLELLRTHDTLVVQDGWSKLQECVQHLIDEQLPCYNDALNPIFRECLSVAAIAQDASWITLARQLLCRMPTHLRQEAEFNLQMIMYQSPSIIRLVIVGSMEPSSTNSGAHLRWQDAVILCHAVRASKPILYHHQVTNARSALKDDTFMRAQTLMRIIFEREESRKSTRSTHFSEVKGWHALTEQIFSFGGHQVFAREWKASILLDMAYYWIEERKSCKTSRSSVSHNFVSLPHSIIYSVFSLAPEVRNDILRHILELIKQENATTIGLALLTHLVQHYKPLVLPYSCVIEDWLSNLVHSHLSDAASCFSVVAPMATVNKDFYNFLMVFLRKLLSSSNQSLQQLSINVWCSWLESRLGLDATQEEETVMAIKHGIQHTIAGSQEQQIWCFRRLKLLFDKIAAPSRDTSTSKHRCSAPFMRHSSWVELHRLVVDTISTFISVKNASSTQYVEVDDDDDDEHKLSYFWLRPWGGICLYNSLSATLNLGVLFESVVSCLLSLEYAYEKGASKSDEMELTVSWSHGSSIVHWISVFVKNSDQFFEWIGADPVPGTDESSSNDQRTWGLDARIALGSAMCSIVLRTHLEKIRSCRLNETTESIDDECLSIWKLCEMQICLRRLNQRIFSTNRSSNVEPSIISHTKTIMPQLLRTNIVFLLIQIAKALNNDSGQAQIGLSLDAACFVLDACCSTPESFTDSDKVEASHEMDALLSVYDNVLKNVKFPQDRHGGLDIVFSVYSETLVAQIPKSIRPLLTFIDGNSNTENKWCTSTAVMMDPRAADELLSRVCLAISLLLERQINSSETIDCESITHVLKNRLNSNHTEGEVHSVIHANIDNSTCMANFVAGVLENVRLLMSIDDLPKFKMAGTMLVKRMVEIAMTKDEAMRDIRQRDAWVHVAQIAYDICCDHVVHHVPLLRVLLGICFSAKLWVIRDKRVSHENIPCSLNADENHSSANQAADDLSSQDFVLEWTRQVFFASGFECPKPVVKPKNDKQTIVTTVRKRGRLRQTVTESEDEEQDVPLPSAMPQLLTASAKAAAVQSILPLLEVLQGSLLRFTALKGVKVFEVGCAKKALHLFYQVNELIVHTAFTTSDVTWVTTRVLMRLVAMLEMAVRIGKLCAALASKKAAPPLHDATAFEETQKQEDDMSIVTSTSFESSVYFAIRGRQWLAMLRDCSQQPYFKSKISATLLKIDVFLVNVPRMVETMIKSTALDDTIKKRIRGFVSSVISDLAPQSSMRAQHPKKHTAKCKRARVLVGVVPIVKKKKRRLRSRNAFIDSCLREEDGDDAFADLEDFIE